MKELIQKEIFFSEFKRLFILYIRNITIFFYLLFGIPVPWVLFYSSITISIYVLNIPVLLPVIYYSSCFFCHQVYSNLSKSYLKFKIPKLVEYLAVTWWVISWIFLND